MRRINLAIAMLAGLLLAGCSTLQTVGGAYTFATETTVPAEVVIPVANSFDILKAGAVNYGRYCIANGMRPSACSASIRRVVVRSVKAGTGARNQLEVSLRTNQPAASSLFNVLVAAVNDLQSSPASSTQFKGGQ